MTLIIAALNQSSIVVGADSLRGKEGKIYLDAKKLYFASKNCVILVAGYLFDSGRVNQFLNDFIDNIHQNKVTDVDIVATELSRIASKTISVDGTYNIIFLVAGFSGNMPMLFCIQSRDNFIKSRHIVDYLAAGMDKFANELCGELGVNNKMTTGDLELAINKILLMTSGEYPGSVGGRMKVKVLVP